MKLPAPFRRLARSTMAWQLSGLTYSSAVWATRGRLMSRGDYLAQSLTQMEPLRALFKADDVALEYGCGLGGNLVASHRWYSRGVGLDVNPGYIRIADGLARRVNAGNLSFAVLRRGETQNWRSRFDVVFSLGVFERLRPGQVQEAIGAMRTLLRPGGRIAAYFLSARARGSALTAFLGDVAYYFWSDEEARALICQAGLEVIDAQPWGGSVTGAEAERGPAGTLYTLEANSH